MVFGKESPMQQRNKLIAAVALTVGTMGFFNVATAQDTGDKARDAGSAVKDAARDTGAAAKDAARDTKDAAKDAAGNVDVRTEETAGATGGLPAGIQKASKDDSEDIRDILAQVTEAAVTRDGFDDIVERFVDADRNRIGTFLKSAKPEQYTTLNGIVAQLDKDFQAKYGQKFDMKEDIVFGNQYQGMTLVQGEIVNPALLSNWPVQQKSGTGAKIDARPGDTTIKADVDVKNDGKVDNVNIGKNEPDRKNDGKIDLPKVDVNAGELGKPSNKASDKNLDKGRNVAILMLPSMQGSSELTVSLVHELPDSWKIDVPDNVDGQKLLNNLQSHLTKFAQQKDQWPADVNEAYRHAAHHVLQAIYDLPTQGAAAGGAGAGAAGGIGQ